MDSLNLMHFKIPASVANARPPGVVGRSRIPVIVWKKQTASHIIQQELSVYEPASSRVHPRLEIISSHDHKKNKNTH